MPAELRSCVIGALDRRRSAVRSLEPDPLGSAPLRAAPRAHRPGLRRAGGDRHLEREAVQRPRRVVGASAGDDRDPRCGQHGAIRSAAGVRPDRRACEPPVRQQRERRGAAARRQGAIGERQVLQRWLTWEWSELDDTSLSGATILSGKAITVDDWDNRPADQFPTSPVPRTTGIEVACLPMLRDGVAVGSIGVSRPMRGGYTGAEVSLLQTFANQAAIAVENARLLREIEQRNAELAESLELQTATGEILRAHQRQPRRPAQGVRRHRRPGRSSVRRRRGGHQCARG